MVTSSAAIGGAADLPIKDVGEGAPVIPDPFKTGVFNTHLWNTPATGAATGGNANVVAVAKGLVGTPYVWGGTSPRGFDCSGFVQYVFARNGISLPRMSFQQANAGANIAPADAQPGDLVSWDNSSRNNGADHIAIYVGNGQVIASPKPGDSVKIQPLWGNYRVTRIGGGK